MSHCLPTDIDVTEVVGVMLTRFVSDVTDYVVDKVVSICITGVSKFTDTGLDAPDTVAPGDFKNFDMNAAYSE